MSRRMTSKGFAQEMIDSMIDRGFVPSAEIMAFATPFPGTDKVTTDQLGKLWRAASLAMNDEFLGRGEQKMPSGSFALLCHCVLHAGTLRRAIPRALAFLQIALGNLAGALSLEHGSARITLKDSGNPQHPTAFSYRMYWILVHGLSCWLVGRRIPLQCVDFSCTAPALEADYQLFFGTVVRFGQATNSLVFDDRFLHLPIRRSDAALVRFLRDTPQNILIRYRQETDFTTRISAMLRSQSPDAWPNFDTAARRLRLSTASLRRQLAVEGRTFQQIKDDIRKGLATHWLATKPDNVSEIAQRLGFADPGAFYRAFRKWTGQSPAAYRLSVRGISGKRLDQA